MSTHVSTWKPVYYIEGVMCSEMCGRHGTMLVGGFLPELEPTTFATIMLKYVTLADDAGFVPDPAVSCILCNGEIKLSGSQQPTDKRDHSARVLQALSYIATSYYTGRVMRFGKDGVKDIDMDAFREACLNEYPAVLGCPRSPSVPQNIVRSMLKIGQQFTTTP